MKDLRKMDIEGIETHLRCYKLFFHFLKMKKKYLFFKEHIFLDRKLSLCDFFGLLNRNKSLFPFSFNDYEKEKLKKISLKDANVVEKWFILFDYISTLGFFWGDYNIEEENNDISNERRNIEYMRNFVKEWKTFLLNNFEKNRK